MIYTLMNKDTPLIDFQWEIKGYKEVAVARKVYQQPWFIRDLGDWLELRAITKHREHMGGLVNMLRLPDTRAILQFSKGLSITDTLWVNCGDRYTWADVNPFTHEFNPVIQEFALEGTRIPGSTEGVTPEFGTDGAYAKCWVRESDGIYLYKKGSWGFANSGWEIYSEMYASDLLDQLGWAHAKYGIVDRKGKLYTKCKAFTSERDMWLPIAAVFDKPVRLRDVVAYCDIIVATKQLAEYLITDALILNEDRHLGNIGLLCDADTFEVKGLSPIYDNGMSLCCLYRANLENTDIFDYAKRRHPSQYVNFGHMAVQVATKEQIEQASKLAPFKFGVDSKWHLAEGRVEQLEQIVNRQIERLISERIWFESRMAGTERTDVFGG